MLEFTRLKVSYGKPWSDKLSVPVTRDLLAKIGECLVRQFVKEALKDFAKRGLSVKDPMGGPDLGDSFSYHVLGKSTVEITSSFYGMDVLAEQATPPHKTPKKVKRKTKTPLETATEMVKPAARRKPVEANIHPGIAKFTFAQRAMKKGKEMCLDIVSEHIEKLFKSGNLTLRE